MKQIKSKKKQSATANIKTALLTYHKYLLQRRAEDLGVLFLKSYKLIRRLIDRGDLPTSQEIDDFAEKTAMFKSKNIKSFVDSHALQTITALGLSSFDDSFTRVINALKIKIQSEDSLKRLNDACYSLAYFFLYKYPDITNREMYKFEFVEHRLTKQTSEAIGFWTGRLELRKHGEAGGKKREKNSAILEAITKFIRVNNLILVNNKQIQMIFCDKVDSQHEMSIKIEGEEYILYCDGKDVISTKGNDERTTKKIDASTLRTEYIPAAKILLFTSEVNNKQKKSNNK